MKRANKRTTVLVRRTNLEKAFEEASGSGLRGTKVSWVSTLVIISNISKKSTEICCKIMIEGIADYCHNRDTVIK